MDDAYAYLGCMFEKSTYSLDVSANMEHLAPPLFTMKGVSAGPRLVVTAPEDLARALAERLWDLPSLGRMRGSLVVRSDAQDPAFDLPDFTLSLSQSEETVAYFDILGRMAELGMINGRGVPLRRVA